MNDVAGEPADGDAAEGHDVPAAEEPDEMGLLRPDPRQA